MPAFIAFIVFIQESRDALGYFGRCCSLQPSDAKPATPIETPEKRDFSSVLFAYMQGGERGRGAGGEGDDPPPSLHSIAGGDSAEEDGEESANCNVLYTIVSVRRIQRNNRRVDEPRESQPLFSAFSHSLLEKEKKIQKKEQECRYKFFLVLPQFKIPR